MEINLLTHRDHPLSFFQNISSHMSLPWPIKERFMDQVKGDQEEHPYDVGLKSGIEAKLSEFLCKELSVSEECCECVKDHCGRQIY